MTWFGLWALAAGAASLYKAAAAANTRRLERLKSDVGRVRLYGALHAEGPATQRWYRRVGWTLVGIGIVAEVVALGQWLA